MRTLVILPTYNERENLEPVIAQILLQAEEIEVLVVDDNSPDGTGRIADTIAQADQRVHVLHRERKEGLGRAYVAGFRFGLEHDYDVIVEMDADFSHRPKDLPRLLAAIADADVVIGSRWVPGGRTESWSLLRRAISRFGSLYAGRLLGVPIADLTSGFKCFRRQVLECLDLDAIHSNGYGFQVELNYACSRAGSRITEVPIVFPDRTRGDSKMNWRIVLEAALLVPMLRLSWARVPLRPSPALSGPEALPHWPAPQLQASSGHPAYR
jgi:dolichol-phosphate mannosyltransferase